MVAFPLPVDQRLVSQLAAMGRQLTLVAHTSNNPVSVGTTLNRDGLQGQAVLVQWSFPVGDTQGWVATNGTYVPVTNWISQTPDNDQSSFGLVATGGAPFYATSPQVQVVGGDMITIIGDIQCPTQLSQVFMEVQFFDVNGNPTGSFSDQIGPMGPSNLTVTSAELYQVNVPQNSIVATVTIGDNESSQPAGTQMNFDNVRLYIYTGIPGVVDATQIIGSQFLVGGPEGGLFVYAGTPQAGNLIGSWTGSPGVDEFGNQYTGGLAGNQGLLQGMSMLFSTLTSCEIDNPSIIGGTWSVPTLIGGGAVETTITFDTAGGALLVYLSGVTSTTLTGAGTWTAPVGSTGPGLVELWGDGGSGGQTSGAAGGGGGEYAAEPTYSIVAGKVYNYHCGQGGSGVGTGNGLAGVGTSFDDNNIFANGGQGGQDFNGGLGGTGSPNTTAFPGGKGGNAFDDAGAGGGSSASAGSAGNPGTDSHGSSGSSGGTAPSGGGNGGSGGNNGASGSPGATPGGGGGGAGNGATGVHTRTYNATKTGSYFGMDAATFGGTAGGQRNINGSMFQGFDTSTGGSVNGTQWSVVEFNTSQIQSDLSGATIDSIAIVFKDQHAQLNSGLTLEVAGIGAFTFPSVAGSLPTSGDLTLYTIASNQTKTLSLPPAYGTKFQNGTYSGILLGPGVGTPTEFGYVQGGTNTGCPQLVVTYHTGGGALQAGAGAAGQIKITYKSNTGRTLIGSWSGSTFTDNYGNAIPIGPYLPNQSAPAAGAGGPVLYGASGHLKYISSQDGATYNTGEQRVVYNGGGQSITTTTLTQITGITLPVNAGVTYEYEFWCMVVGNSNSGVGIDIQAQGPGTSGNSFESFYFCNASGNVTQQIEEFGTFGTAYGPVGTLGTGYQIRYMISGVVTFSASGNLVVKVGESGAGSAFTVKGASLKIRPIA